MWIASVGRDVELTPGAHLYFADRYLRLARVHRRVGRVARAVVLENKARAHLEQSGDDGPPFAAAMAMPRPTRFIRTDAVGHASTRGPDDAA